MSSQHDSKPEQTIQDVDRTATPVKLYKYTFFSPEGAPARKSLWRGTILPTIYNAILMWACLSLFFGSLLKSNDISKIGVVAVNLDDGFVGAAVMDGINKSLHQPGPHLKWRFEGYGEVAGDAWSRGLVLQEKTWAVFQVSANASSALLHALENGDASYDPLSAMTLYYASARNQVTILSTAVPAIQGLINPILSQIAISSTSTYLNQVTNSINKTALPSALRCPQCLASPFAIKPVDLVPFSYPAAFGALNTGVIFLLTFTFNVFTILRAGAEAHGHLFNLCNQLAIRTISSFATYLFLSLMYTLIILAFSIPLTGHFGATGSGFMVLWMANWMTMGACGLVMEAVGTVIGMRWGPFLLNVWLIINVSGAFSSFELMPGFYKYGYAVPFYHCIQATRTIVFGTKSHLGLNFGVLIAWVAVGLGGVYLATAWRMKRAIKTGIHRVP